MSKEEITPGLPAEDPTTESESTEGFAMLQVTPRDEYMAAFANVQAPDFGIAPLGDDLQPAPVETPAPQLDLSAISLAPVGSDMGQLSRVKTERAPDTTHFELLDE